MMEDHDEAAAASEIHFSHGDGITDNKPRQCVVPNFAALVAWLEVHRAAKKETAGYFAGPLGQPGLRRADNAQPRRFLVFDLDRIHPDAHPDVRMWFMGFSGVAWATHSSKPEAPRERIVLETNREATRAECMVLGGIFKSKLEADFGVDVVVDPSTFRGEQPVFLPPVGVQIARFDGEPLDVDQYVKAAAPGAPVRPVARPGPAPAAVKAKVREGGRHAHLVRWASQLNWRGLDAAVIRVALQQENERACDPPKTDAEVEAILQDVLKRYAHQHARDLAPGGDVPTQAPAPQQGPAGAPAEDESPLPPEFSDDQLAVEFAEACGDDFRWTPGPGWHANTGIVWRRDETLLRFDLARRVCRAAAARVPNASTVRQRLTSAKTVHAVLSLAQTDQRLVVPSTAWDSAQHCLNTPDGIVDLRNGRLRPRTAADYVTQATRVGPDFNTGAELFERFLSDIFNGDQELIDFMQRAMGYLLTGERSEQVLFFWWGPSGGNGKSTLLDLLQWVLDSYSVKLPAAALMVARNERHPTELAQLRSKRVAFSSELEEGQFWNESLIKELTGDAVLTARFMRGDFFEFPMTQKHVIVGNHKPRLRGGDPAIARRLVLVPFEQRFEGMRRDKDMPAKLRAEAPAILAWLVRGAVRWYRDGLGTPPRVREASAEYMGDHDDMALWLDECCVRSGDTKASELYASFAEWKKRRGEHPPSMTTWGQRMQVVQGITRRKSDGIRYTGVQLNSTEAARLWATN